MTENKRFNYTCEKTGQHWCIEISDNQTKEPFDVDYSEITDNYSQTKDNVEFIVGLLNDLHEEKEFWKSNCLSQDSFNQILLHELDIAREQGYKVSNPFKKLLEKKE